MSLAYIFQVKSIQAYIFRSSRLKDMIGASELLENLCTKEGLLSKTLEVLQLEERRDLRFVRRAGGAIIALFNEAESLAKFQAVWTLQVQRKAAGLQFEQAIAAGENDLSAVDAARKQLKASPLFTRLPVTGPLVTRSPRTGGPAVDIDDRKERIDAVMANQRRFSKADRLIAKLLPKKYTEQGDAGRTFNVVWPTNLNKDDDSSGEMFPMASDNSFIGIVHADGNGMGKVLEKLGDSVQEHYLTDYAEIFRQFSEALQTSTAQAARDAVISVLIPEALIRERYPHDELVMPARPLIIGGDDVTFIIRGDLALKFSIAFLEAFEKHSKTQLQPLHDNFEELVLPDYFTACAGIAYVKAKQPFYRAYHLAEDLCGYAKQFFRNAAEDDNELTPSSLAFQRITSSTYDNWREQLKAEQPEQVRLGMAPYLAGDVKPTQDLVGRASDLQLMVEYLNTHPNISLSALHECVNTLETSESFAVRIYERWLTQFRNSNELDEFKDRLDELVGHVPGFIRTRQEHRDRTAVKCTPLSDVLTLLSLQQAEGWHDAA